MKKRRILATMLCCAAVMPAALSFTACGNDKITIWTSAEDYRIDFYTAELKKKFPEFSIQIEYMNTSMIASKVAAEGDSCSADILLSEEYAYLSKCEPYLAELTDFDFSPYLDELVPASKKYTPEVRNGGCVIINRSVLERKNAPVPTSYSDLLDPVYKDLICMPSPASSGTGYMFLRQFTNEWGEDEAFEYFAALNSNILTYPSSGSGPINKLVQGEVGIGLGMTAQAVTEINKGSDLEILYFEEGSPYGMYGNAVLSKSVKKDGVMAVFKYLSIELCKEDNRLFFPEPLFKDFHPEIEGYPTDIHYGDMSNDTLAEKERLLKKWTLS